MSLPLSWQLINSTTNVNSYKIRAAILTERTTWINLAKAGFIFVLLQTSEVSNWFGILNEASQHCFCQNSTYLSEESWRLQESILVGCAPPAFLVPVGLPPPRCRPSLETDPPRQTPGGRHSWRQTPPSVNRMIGRCKNITLPQTSFVGGKNYLALSLNISRKDIGTDGKWGTDVNRLEKRYRCATPQDTNTSEFHVMVYIYPFMKTDKTFVILLYFYTVVKAVTLNLGWPLFLPWSPVYLILIL